MSALATADWFGGGFTPHGFCLAWDPSLLALHVVSDGLIALAYYSIPLALLWLVLCRRGLLFGWTVLLFAAFIVACGTTHVLDIWTLWHADYLGQGIVKAVTAAISVLTAALLWPIIPKLVALPSHSALAEANSRLAQQIHEKEMALQALHREIAERQRAEAMLRHAQKMQAVGQLTGGIAHDFNNLLMVVQGNLEVLKRRLAGETAIARYLDRSLSAVDRGALLTQQLLAFARRQPLQPTVFDANDRIRGLAPLLSPTVGDRARLKLDLAPELWPVEADPAQLDAALMNLAMNARQAMPDGGELTIRTANVEQHGLDGLHGELDAEDVEPGDYVMIAVTDTGIGMSPEVREKAFEPFFTTRPTGIGSGLGLSQIYGFVKQSRGRVFLHTEPGRGTTVTLLLRRPASSASPVPLARVAASS